MMKLVLLSFLVAAVVVQADPDFDDDFIDFPGQRFNPWSILSEETIQHAQNAGWNESSWNVIGSSDLETLGYNELSPQQLEAVQAIGFTLDQQWDCYMSHYNSYSWDSLVERNIHRHLETLGWTEESWTDTTDDDIPEEIDILENTPWSELTEEQQDALEAVCWFPEQWDGFSLEEMDYIPRAYPKLRYTAYESLTNDQQFLVTQAGWTETAWNNPATAMLEAQGFMERNVSERNGLTRLGFYQNQYDCYINHYQSYAWDEIVEFGLDGAAVVGGYTAESWGNWSSTLDDLDWNELTQQQQDSLIQFCWFEEIWNMQPLGTWNNDNNDMNEEQEEEHQEEEQGADEEEEEGMDGIDQEEEESSANNVSSNDDKTMSSGLAGGIAVIVVATVATLLWVTYKRSFSKGMEYAFTMDTVSSTLSDFTDTADDKEASPATTTTGIKGFVV